MKPVLASIIISTLLLLNGCDGEIPSPTDTPKMTIQEKKQRFRELLVPAVTEVYHSLNKRYLEVALEIEKKSQSARITELKKEYKAASDQELLAALKPHPISIALAQAAMESAWGTSRFFRDANNVFGIWSFNPHEPRIAAGKKRGDKTIWVKRYKNVTASVLDYYRIIGRGDAFTAFRALRLNSNDPFMLVTMLDKYSERGEEYGRELMAMIRFNKFTDHDQNNAL